MTRRAMLAYARTSLENEVAAASPHKLILMLMDGAITQLHAAKGALAKNEIGKKGAALSKAMAIIEQGLWASLNEEAGGELSTRLGSLYEYMCGRLVVANAKSDEAAIDEVLGLLSDLRNTWESIGAVGATGAAP